VLDSINFAPASAGNYLSATFSGGITKTLQYGNGAWSWL
jgi:hypothetical protein